ncbi:MAG: PLP-dependent aspartate aminotransferase family protein [Wenzhouxiangellaceae bacterium]|nr:PLP-dependent aspartate aminotransferase family protein [Wenzhouxiangellaceae bacterium]
MSDRDDSRPDPHTLCVHAGERRGLPEHGVNTPIVTSTAFDYSRDGKVRYPRYLNTPNHRIVAERIAALEHAETAFVTASGLGAISAVFMALCRPGDHVLLLDGLYGGTVDLCEELLRPWGLGFSTWDGDPETLPGALRDNTRLAWVESPTNPLLDVVDLEATASILRERGIVSVVDNTFATPILQRPLDFGFDLVMHSGTKYLGGHSDLLCGALAGPEEIVEPCRAQAIRLGSSLNGQDLALLERSLKTLGIRVERQSANALRVAEWLAGRDDIEAVHYPGLSSAPGHDVARRQMRGFGGMLSFRLADSADPDRFLAGLRLASPAISLGGVESTICQPLYTSHARLSEPERERLGIDARLMRYSTGIEHAEDLVDDLATALGRSG